MLKIGLTGGIASGKSTVADTLAKLGASVVDTDLIAREVVAPGTPGLDSVVSAFGAEVLADDGSLDRQKLRSLVFDDAASREMLESLLHPLIRKRTRDIVEELVSRAASPYLVLVVPLLVETDFSEPVDRVLVVDSAPDMQRERLIRRDHCTEQEANSIMRTQADRSARLAAADDVISNNGNLKELRLAAEQLHARYLQFAMPAGS